MLKVLTFEGELSQSFMQGMQKWPRGNTAKICIQALTLQLFELPLAVYRLIPGILVKVSQTTSSNIGVLQVGV